jgi:adenylosuccinate synthase
MMEWEDLVTQWTGNIVFEGAQGLQLNMDNKENFPHVTRSETGTKNAKSLLRKGDIKEQVDVYYVTRTYLTRHGAGPMPHETGRPYENIVDETNIRNRYQGALRFSKLDLELLREAIHKDSKDLPDNFKKHLVVTCCDQIDDGIVKCHGQHNPDIEMELGAFLKYIKESLGVERVWTSHGPTRHDIKVAIQ